MAAMTEGYASEKSLEDAGVPKEHVTGVLKVWEEIREEAQEMEDPLAEPLMLLRFLRAREFNVEKAVLMWRTTMDWRATKISRALEECGRFEGEGWTWRPRDDGSIRGKLGALHGHARRLPKALADDGAPICVWRMGKFDLAGVVREKIEDAMAMTQVANLEDSLQASRAMSNEKKKLIRARVIVDLDGISVTTAVRHFGLVKRLMGLAKAYFPEVTASVTLIRAPWGFQSLWKFVSLLLNDMMRAKVLIVGSNDVQNAVKNHAKITSDVNLLPVCLGGSEPDDILAPTLSVPTGAGDDLRSDPAPPFLPDIPHVSSSSSLSSSMGSSSSSSSSSSSRSSSALPAKVVQHT